MARKRMLAVVILAGILSIGAGVLYAAFSDPGNSFNNKLWNKAEWSLGKGYVRAANAGCSGGYYTLKLKAKTWDGAEIYTPSRYGYGLARASFKCPVAAGSISSLFFYQGVTSKNDEIDIEVYKNGSSWRIDFVVWKGGTKTWADGFNPTFDPSAAYHEYAIDYAVNGIAFFVDGQNKKTCPKATSRPSNSMQIHLNCWWPTWLSSAMPTSDKFMQVDSIAYQ